VKAPHVATLVSTLPVGRQVAAGETVAVLSVLDEDIALAAPVAGRCLAQAAAGALVEFDTPI
jgi:biotin carboxyl carrier protein